MTYASLAFRASHGCYRVDPLSVDDELPAAMPESMTAPLIAWAALVIIKRIVRKIAIFIKRLLNLMGF